MESKPRAWLLAAALLEAALLLGSATVQAQPVVTTPASPDLQAEFDEAIRAIEADRLRTARETLDTMVKGNPSLQRARLELARVYYLSQDYPKARAEAQQVLDDPNTPASVRTTVMAFLRQIDAEEAQFMARHQWQPWLYAGLMYDSNVNVGPARDVIDIGGLPYLVAPGSQEKSDFAAVINPGITHTYNPGSRFDSGEHPGFFLWQSSLSGYYRAYFDESDYNLGILTGRTGPAWVVPRHWNAGIGLQLDQIWLDGNSTLPTGEGTDSDALFSTLNPYITWEFDGVWELTLDGAVTNRHYWDDAEDGRDGWYKGVMASGVRYFADRQFALQAGIGGFDFEAEDERFSNSGPDVFVGAMWAPWPRGTVYGRVGWRNYDFEGAEPLFGVARDEDEYRYAVGLQHQFDGGLKNWALQAGWIYTDNQSNLDLYDFDRHEVSVGLVGRF